MVKDVKEKTILITGASSGIGKETAYQLAKNDANLILAARRIKKLKVVQAKCEEMGSGKISICPIDLSNIHTIDYLENFIDRKNIQINFLINAAGIGHAGSFIEMDYEKIEKMLKVNLLGLMYLTQRIALQMVNQNKGQIINLASLAGKVPRANQAVYAASKAALIAFSNSLRLELSQSEIDVTVINFGPVDSPFFDKIAGLEKEKSLNSFFTLETEEAARIVVKSIGRKKKEVNRPILLNIGSKLYTIFPTLVDKILLKYFQ